MIYGHSIHKKARYICSVAVLQAVTLLFAFYTFNPWLITKSSPAAAEIIQPPPPPKRNVISGVPKRLIISRLGIDLNVLNGSFNTDDQTWTLSGLNAHFADISSEANDYSGSTFIYGHNNKNVFGKLADVRPGDQVQLVTANGFMFSYVYESAHNTRPDDVSALNYKGEPILTVQTCSGSFNEWRRMFRFRFDSVKRISTDAV
jgi:LPXTG-site transpeptidase (sortase) family protein